MCRGSSPIARVVTGVKKSFSSPGKALATVGTGGLYGVVNENKKASADAAVAGAAAFITSGGNPAGLVAGAVTGAIKGGTDKRSIADSVKQSAVIGGIEGGVTYVGAALTKAKAAADAASLKAAGANYSADIAAAQNGGYTNFVETSQSFTPQALGAAPGTFGDTAGASFNVTTAGTGGSSLASGWLAAAENVGSSAYTGIKTFTAKALDTVGLTYLAQTIAGKPQIPAGDGGYSPPGGTTPYDTATASGVNPQTGIVQIPPDAGGGSSSSGPDLQQAGVLAALLPMGFVVGAVIGLYALYKWWKKRHRN